MESSTAVNHGCSLLYAKNTHSFTAGFSSQKRSEGNRERTAAVSSSSRRVKERKNEREMSSRSLQNNNTGPSHIKINTGLCL